MFDGTDLNDTFPGSLLCWSLWWLAGIPPATNAAAWLWVYADLADGGWIDEYQA